MCVPHPVSVGGKSLPSVRRTPLHPLVSGLRNLRPHAPGNCPVNVVNKRVPSSSAGSSIGSSPSSSQTLRHPHQTWSQLPPTKQKRRMVASFFRLMFSCFQHILWELISLRPEWDYKDPILYHSSLNLWWLQNSVSKGFGHSHENWLVKMIMYNNHNLWVSRGLPLALDCGLIRIILIHNLYSKGTSWLETQLVCPHTQTFADCDWYLS